MFRVNEKFGTNIVLKISPNCNIVIKDSTKDRNCMKTTIAFRCRNLNPAKI